MTGSQYCQSIQDYGAKMLTIIMITIIITIIAKITTIINSISVCR